MKAQSGPDYPEMAREAVTAALRDAGLAYTAVEAVVAGYCYGEPTCGTCLLPTTALRVPLHSVVCTAASS
jgi:sterol carrier protein 2